VEVKKDPQTPAANGGLLKLVAELVRPYRRDAIWVGACGVAACGVTMVQAGLSTRVSDRFSDGEPPVGLTSLWLALIVVTGVLSWTSSWKAFLIGRAVAVPLANELFERLLGDSLEEHKQRDRGAGQDLITNVLTKVGPTVSTVVGSLVASTAQGVGALLAIMVIDWRWGLGVAPILFGICATEIHFSTRSAGLQTQKAALTKRQTGLIAQVFTGALFKVVKGNALEPPFTERFVSCTGGYDTLERKRRFEYSFFLTGLNALPQLALPITLVVGYLTGVNIPTLIVMAALIQQAISNGGQMSWSYHQLEDAAPYIRGAQAVMATEPTGAPTADPEHEALDPASLAGAQLVLEEVRFAYGDGPEVLKGISRIVNPGDVCVVVGPNGSGKSTLFGVIAGIRIPQDPKSATVREIPLGKLPARWRNRVVATVDPEPTVFEGTVRDNLLLFDKQATTTELEWACGVALIPAELLDTDVDNLSTGWRMRVLIARAILLRPLFLLFDETFAHLDPVTLRDIVAAIRRALPKTGIVVISHQRDAESPGVDQILVINDGELVQAGTLAELLADPDGAYQRFVRLTQPFAADVKD
jgi:ABC-type multidrug transport system fused ATPase/permease subunit